MLKVEGVGKAFTLHLQGGVVLPVLDGVALEVQAGSALR